MRRADIAETEPGDLVLLKPMFADPAVLLESHGLFLPQPIGLALEHLVVLLEPRWGRKRRRRRRLVLWRGGGGGGGTAEDVPTALGQAVAVGEDLGDIGDQGELNDVHGVRSLVANVAHDLHDAVLVNPSLELAKVQIGESAEGLLHQFLDSHADVGGGSVDRPAEITPRVRALKSLTARLLAKQNPKLTGTVIDGNGQDASSGRGRIFTYLNFFSFF